jgi:hypothetical protein
LAVFWSKLLPLTRHFLRTILCLIALNTLIAVALPIAGAAVAQNAIATSVAKPVSLPDMALGQPAASITIVEYSSLTCPHCAAFAENVFPMLQLKYIDTGKVRFVSRLRRCWHAASATAMPPDISMPSASSSSSRGRWSAARLIR